jgi:hypothetical protein
MTPGVFSPRGDDGGVMGASSTLTGWLGYRKDRLDQLRRGCLSARSSTYGDQVRGCSFVTFIAHQPSRGREAAGTPDRTPEERAPPRRGQCHRELRRRGCAAIARHDTAPAARSAPPPRWHRRKRMWPAKWEAGRIDAFSRRSAQVNASGCDIARRHGPARSAGAGRLWGRWAASFVEPTCSWSARQQALGRCARRVTLEESVS